MDWKTIGKVGWGVLETPLRFLNDMFPDSTLPITDLENEEEEKKKKGGVRQAVDFMMRIKNVIASPSVGRIMMIISSILLMVFTPAPIWLAALGLVGGIGSIALGLCVETLEANKIKKIKTEYKLLGKLIELEAEVMQLMKKAGLDNRLMCKFSGYQRQDHGKSMKAVAMGAMIKTGPELFANILICVIRGNPISIAINSVITVVSYAMNVSANAKFSVRKVHLLKEMEELKERLGISYEIGNGVPLLKDLVNMKLAEKIALEEVIKGRADGAKGFEETRNLIFNHFSGVLKNDDETKKAESIVGINVVMAEKQDGIIDRTTAFFQTMAERVFYGFSSAELYERSDPLYRLDRSGTKSALQVLQKEREGVELGVDARSVKQEKAQGPRSRSEKAPSSLLVKLGR